MTFYLLFSIVLVVALEKVERTSGSLVGSSIASIQKNTAPKVSSGFSMLKRQLDLIVFTMKSTSLYLTADVT